MQHELLKSDHIAVSIINIETNRCQSKQILKDDKQDNTIIL